MRSLSLCLALLCAAPALAQQDGGFFAEGFRFDDPHGPLPASPLWQDQSGRLITRDFSTQALKCYQPVDGGFQFLQDLTTVNGSRGTLLVGPGKDVFPLLFVTNGSVFSVIYVTCGGPFQGDSVYTFDAGMAPAVNPPTWPEAADGGHYYVSNSGLSLFAETPAPSVRLLHSHQELTAAMGVTAADGGVSPERVSALAMGTAPDGTLYFAVSARLPRTGQFDVFQTDLLERTPQGELRRRFSQQEPITKVPSIAYSAAFDAVLVDGFSKALTPEAVYPLLAVFPTGGTPGPLFPQGMPPWPVPPKIPFPNRAYGGFSGGSANEIHANAGDVWYRLTPDPLRADYDRDGLRAVEEAQLGTSDFLADFDGDGRSDFAEVVRWHTDPRDAGSRPEMVPPPPLVFAPNHFTRMLPLFPPACRADNSFSFAPVMCSHEPCLPNQLTADCFNPDLSLLGNIPGGAGFIAPEDGGRTEYVMHATQGVDDRWTITHIPTGAQTVHEYGFSPGSTDAIPLSATKVLVRALDSSWNQLVRVGAGEAFAVIDTTRKPCPILPNAAADCAAPEHASPPVLRFLRLGYSPELKGVLVSVDTTQGRTLYAVTDDDMVRLADITDAFGGLPPNNILPLSAAGFTGYLVSAQVFRGGTSLVSGTYELDPAFDERTPPRRFMDSGGTAGAFFRTGYQDRLHTTYLAEASASGPMRYVRYQFEVEWEPVRPELQRGEVLAFGQFRDRPRGSVTQIIFNPVTGVFEDSVTYGTPEWILWRTTPQGGTVEWLLRQEFEALLSAEDREVLARTPLGPIRSMNASPDARKVCLAEPAAGRTWEVLLDANGKLEGARLGSATAGVGCAYDEASELVTLSKSPTEVRRGGTVLGTVPAMVAPIGLYRAGGSWMVQGYLEPLHCLADSGAVSSSGVVVTALSVISGGVAYIQGDGSAYTSTADDLCQRLGPSERLSGGNLWRTVYSRFTTRGVNAVQASMVMRPDGLMFVSGFDLDVGGLGRSPQVVPHLTFNVWPQFRPVERKSFPEHNGFRIEQELADVSSISATGLQAMTILPGASPTRDWGYVKRLGTPLDTSSGGEDAGVPDDGMPKPEPEDPPPCGCGSAGSGVPLLALALLALARRRS